MSKTRFAPCGNHADWMMRLRVVVVLGGLLFASSGAALAVHHAEAGLDHASHQCDICLKLVAATAIVSDEPVAATRRDADGRLTAPPAAVAAPRPRLDAEPVSPRAPPLS